MCFKEEEVNDDILNDYIVQLGQDKCDCLLILIFQGTRQFLQVLNRNVNLHIFMGTAYFTSTSLISILSCRNFLSIC
jgi:hypothetical protein